MIANGMDNFFFEYDAANGIIAARVMGHVDDAVFRALYQAASSQIQACHARSGVADFSSVTSFDVSNETIRDVARMAPLIPDPTPRYIVAPPDHIFGTVRMLQLMSGNRRDGVRVVRTLAEAYQGLGLTSPTFERMD